MRFDESAMIRRRALLVLAASLLGGALFLTFPEPVPESIRRRNPLIQNPKRHTVASRVDQFGNAARARWAPHFKRTAVGYAPAKVLFLALKDEKQLEVWAFDTRWKRVRTLPILRASGEIGPKLREGDGQVPEGFYELESFNPNSAFHVSLRVNYPSDEDKRIAQSENRALDELGGNIMIHGGAASIGCLAMGDESAEDLFALAALVGRSNVQIVMCPLDFRVRDVPTDASRPVWINARYAKLRRFVQTLPRD